MLEQLSVLIIDDDPTFLKAIRRILVAENVHTDIACGCKEGISKIESKVKIYNAIICDLNMPDMNGIEFAKKFHNKFPIIFMTAYLGDEFKDKINQFCDAYIEKLDTSERIYPALLKALERRKNDLFIKAA